MTMAELIEKLKDMPLEKEVVIVHKEWPIIKVIEDEDKVEIS